MEFDFSNKRLIGKERTLGRFLEIIPGFLSWAILIGLSVITFREPFTAAAIVIAFNLYWLLRIIYTEVFLIFSYRRLSLEEKTQWLKRAEGVNRIYAYWKELTASGLEPESSKDLSLTIHKSELRTLEVSKDIPPLLKNIYHMVVILVGEEKGDLETILAGIAGQDFPAQRIFLILSLAGGVCASDREAIESLGQKYKDKFFNLILVDQKEGPRQPAFSSLRLTQAVKEGGKYFKQKNIPSERVIVSHCHSNNAISSDFFSCLTYHYMVSPNRTEKSFQAVPVYHPSIWQLPGIVRAFDVSTSFFQLLEANNPDNLVVFASQSLSLRILEEIGYWPSDMASSSTAVFWKAFVYCDSKYKLVPLPAKSFMNIPKSKNLFKAMARVYRNKRYWALGVENFPIVVRAFLNNRDIPRDKKLKHGFRLLTAQVSWAVWPYLATVFGWISVFLCNQEFADLSLYYSTPRISAIIFTLSFLILLLCLILNLVFLPPREGKKGLAGLISNFFTLILILPVGIFLSAIAALDAQTRLMMGKLSRIDE